MTLSSIRLIGRLASAVALAWGLHCVLTEDAADLDDMVTRATGIAQREGFADSGQRIIITAGLPLGTPGATMPVSEIAMTSGVRLNDSRIPSWRSTADMVVLKLPAAVAICTRSRPSAAGFRPQPVAARIAAAENCLRTARRGSISNITHSSQSG